MNTRRWPLTSLQLLSQCTSDGQCSAWGRLFWTPRTSPPGCSADRRMLCQSIVWTLTFGILEAGWHSAGYQGYDPFTVLSCVFARLLVKDVLSERISPCPPHLRQQRSRKAEHPTQSLQFLPPIIACAITGKEGGRLCARRKTLVEEWHCLGTFITYSKLAPGRFVCAMERARLRAFQPLSMTSPWLLARARVCV